MDLSNTLTFGKIYEGGYSVNFSDIKYQFDIWENYWISDDNNNKYWISKKYSKSIVFGTTIFRNIICDLTHLISIVCLHKTFKDYHIAI